MEENHSDEEDAEEEENSDDDNRMIGEGEGDFLDEELLDGSLPIEESINKAVKCYLKDLGMWIVLYVKEDQLMDYTQWMNS